MPSCLPEEFRHDGDPAVGTVPTTAVSELDKQARSAERPGLASLVPRSAPAARRPSGRFGSPSPGAGCRHPVGRRSPDRTPRPGAAGQPDHARQAAGRGRGGSAGPLARPHTHRPAAWRRRHSSWSRLPMTTRWISSATYRFRGSCCRGRDGISCQLREELVPSLYPSVSL
jgi:hypothetical protein